MVNSEQPKSSQCITCKKKTQLTCSNCNVPICGSHTYLINHKAVCENCLIKEKKKGLLKQWGIIGILGFVAIIVILVL
jgi:hypothetical protein